MEAVRSEMECRSGHASLSGQAAKKLCCLQADLTEMAEQPLEAELCNRRKRYFFGR